LCEFIEIGRVKAEAQIVSYVTIFCVAKMKSIRVQNLRSLKDTGFVDIKPVTLLLGSNSSGKSTFLRVLPLLRQSTEARTMGPILWNGRFIDFGSFEEAASTGTDEISFHFTFRQQATARDDRLYHRTYRRIPLRLLEDTDFRVDITVALDKKREFTIIRKCSISFSENHIFIALDPDASVAELSVNGRKFAPEKKIINGRGGLVPHLIWRLEETRQASLVSEVADRTVDYGLFGSDILEAIQRYAHHKTSAAKIVAMFHGLGLGSPTQMLQNMQQLSSATVTWSESVSHWSIETGTFVFLRNLLIANSIPSILDFISSYIARFSTGNNYVAPIRATAERYYRRQDVAVDEVDFRGQNLPMFIRNLSDAERRHFAQWLEEHAGFSVQVKSAGGHVSLRLRERGSSHEANLADMGFGFSQVLPILTQLWLLSSQRRPRQLGGVPITVSIEQPELHLHPRLQARLMDVFLASIRAAAPLEIDLRFILETHSETMVNRMGHHVAKGQVNPSDLNVVMFEKKSADGFSEISLAEFGEAGFLENWPYGFFEPEVL
jgi:hypothetical protein